MCDGVALPEVALTSSGEVVCCESGPPASAMYSTGTATPTLISSAPRHLRPSLPLIMKMPLIAR